MVPLQYVAQKEEKEENVKLIFLFKQNKKKTKGKK